MPDPEQWKDIVVSEVVPVDSDLTINEPNLIIESILNGTQLVSHS